MSGACAAAVAGALGGRLNATLGVGDSGSGVYGFANFTGNTYGTLSRATFTDGGGATRTVSAIHWDIAASGNIVLRLAGTGITNSDATFRTLRIGSALFARSSATYSGNDAAGNSSWIWGTNTSSYPTSGSVQVAID